MRRILLLAMAMFNASMASGGPVSARSDKAILTAKLYIPTTFAMGSPIGTTDIANKRWITSAVTTAVPISIAPGQDITSVITITYVSPVGMHWVAAGATTSVTFDGARWLPTVTLSAGMGGSQIRMSGLSSSLQILLPSTSSVVSVVVPFLGPGSRTSVTFTPAIPTTTAIPSASFAITPTPTAATLSRPLTALSDPNSPALSGSAAATDVGSAYREVDFHSEIPGAVIGGLMGIGFFGFWAWYMMWYRHSDRYKRRVEQRKQDQAQRQAEKAEKARRKSMRKKIKMMGNGSTMGNKSMGHSTYTTTDRPRTYSDMYVPGIKEPHTSYQRV